MNPNENPMLYATPVAQAAAAERAAFIRRTYTHLAGAVGAFVILEWALLQSAFAEPLVRTMLGGRFSWLIVLGAFMAVGWVADRWARSTTGPGMQYLGLGLYVVAEAIIILPLLWIATRMAPGAVPTAGFLTLVTFGGLTGFVLVTGKDFSFMRGMLAIGGLVAMGFILCSILFGFNLGVVFSAAMVALACGYILYQTSGIMLHYNPAQHVAASLALFASVALLFWYILQIVLSLTGRD